MRCSTWRGNDLTKLNRQIQLWVCPRFEPPTPHLCMMSNTGREPVFLLSFLPSDSYVSNSFTILSPSPLLGVETPPAGPGNLRQIQNIQLQLAHHHLHYGMRYHPSLCYITISLFLLMYPYMAEPYINPGPCWPTDQIWLEFSIRCILLYRKHNQGLNEQ